jgi:hypothetical protein
MEPDDVEEGPGDKDQVVYVGVDDSSTNRRQSVSFKAHRHDSPSPSRLAIMTARPDTITCWYNRGLILA